MKKNIDGVKDNIIFCFWHGPEMSKNRKECYENILSTQDNVILLTEDNLSEFEIATRPIHKGFKYLSSTHKSDYIRSYIMNFYGGGYTDIKRQTSSWTSCFDILNNTDFLGCGYREIHPSHIAINEKTEKNIDTEKISELFNKDKNYIMVCNRSHRTINTNEIQLISRIHVDTRNHDWKLC